MDEMKLVIVLAVVALCVLILVVLDDETEWARRRDQRWRKQRERELRESLRRIK